MEYSVPTIEEKCPLYSSFLLNKFPFTDQSVPILYLCPDEVKGVILREFNMKLFLEIKGISYFVPIL